MEGGRKGREGREEREGKEGERQRERETTLSSETVVYYMCVFMCVLCVCVCVCVNVCVRVCVCVCVYNRCLQKRRVRAGNNPRLANFSELSGGRKLDMVVSVAHQFPGSCSLKEGKGRDGRDKGGKGGDGWMEKGGREGGKEGGRVGGWLGGW